MRQDQSSVLEKLFNENIEQQGMAKIASEKTMEKVATIEKKSSMSLFEARVARRNGSFIKVAGRQDLYQEVETKDFWKISDDKQNVIRVIDDSNGTVKG